MPVVCFLCNSKLNDGREHGFFSPDIEEWQLLTEAQQAICMFGGDMAVHRECYDNLIRGSETSVRKENV